MNELVKLFYGRPPFLETNKGIICISVHDNWHLRLRGLYKKRILNTSLNSRKIYIDKYKAWLEDEKKWYKQFNLSLPEWSSGSEYKRNKEVNKIRMRDYRESRGCLPNWSRRTHCKYGHPTTEKSREKGRCEFCVKERNKRARLI